MNSNTNSNGAPFGETSSMEPGSKVLERLGDNRPGTVRAIDANDLVTVDWPSGRCSTHSRDELRALDENGAARGPAAGRMRARKRRGRETHDAFSGIRRYLPKFRDDDDAVLNRLKVDDAL